MYPLPFTLQWKVPFLRFFIFGRTKTHRVLCCVVTEYGIWEGKQVDRNRGLDWVWELYNSCHWYDPTIAVLPARDPCEGVKIVIRLLGISSDVLFRGMAIPMLI